MKTTLSLLALAGIAGVASAQTMTISWTVGDTGDNDGIIEPGESANLSMWAHMDPKQVGFAGTIYNINGDANWAAGTLNSFNNLLDALTDDGDLAGGNAINNIESFQLPPLFNGSFNASNPIELYRMTWTPASYANALVDVGSSGHLNFDVYTDNFGSSQSYTGVVNRARVQVVPTPASLALLGLGGLVAGRRRR